jgi:hypothetical protein
MTQVTVDGLIDELDTAEAMAAALADVESQVQLAHSDDRVCPQVVISCGGRANAVHEFMRARAAARYGWPDRVMSSVAIDSELAALEPFPLAARFPLGTRMSAPAIARACGHPAFGSIAKATEPHELVKSGEETMLGSNQVPQAAYALALREYSELKKGIGGAITAAKDAGKSSSLHFEPAISITILSTDDGAVGRGTGRLVAALARNVKPENAVIYHVILSVRGFGVPSPLGARASEFAGAVETVLQVTEAWKPLEGLEAGMDSRGANYTIVVPGEAYTGAEESFLHHVAQIAELLRTSLGQVLAGRLRNG